MTQYTLSAWGWCAYELIDGHLCQGQGDTKAGAKKAMLAKAKANKKVK